MIDWTKIDTSCISPSYIGEMAAGSHRQEVLFKVTKILTFAEFYASTKIDDSLVEDFIIAENLSPHIQSLKQLITATPDTVCNALFTLRNELKQTAKNEPDPRKALLATQLADAYDSEHLFVDSPASSTIGFFSSTDLLLDETLIQFATRMVIIIHSMDYLKVRLNPQMVRNTTDIVMRYVDEMDDKATFKSFREELIQALGIIDTNDKLYYYVYEEGINYTHLLQVIAGNMFINTPHAFCSQLGNMTGTELDSHNLDPKQRPKKLRDILSRLSSEEQTILNHNI